ncbi:MAG: rhodanese-related sulfurtransferase, partial [Acidobacteriota bacterium]|nr:rhodanese-related sulfurtransferase [Acidobacteriota bacterium]
MSDLINIKSTDELKDNLQKEKENRRTISFYKYHKIENPQEFRDELFKSLSELNVFGRIYVADEGINAQISVPEKDLQKFVDYLFTYDFLQYIRLNIALEDDGKSFWKLIIRVRRKIVADGIEDKNFSVENKGEYLNAEEFNKLTENPETVVVDMRNFYEYEVGHFENAKEIPADTFREQLPLAAEILVDKQHKPIIMYCTGGIRCEKASAYLRYRGFKKVYHLEGGIIEYIRKVKENNLKNKFKGKNFVFDARMGERITE